MEKQTEAATEIQSNYAYDHNSVQYRQSKFYNVRIITEAHALTLNEKKTANSSSHWKNELMNVNDEMTSSNQFNVKVLVGTKEEITA